MEMQLWCGDCGQEHDEPGEAILGIRVRCLDCQIEVDLALEIAAAEESAAQITRTLAA